MPNRRAHDHIGQFKQIEEKLGIRIGHAQTEKIINNLTELAVAGASAASIDKLVQKIVKDAKFRERFMNDYKGAVQDLKMFDPSGHPLLK